MRVWHRRSRGAMDVPSLETFMVRVGWGSEKPDLAEDP